MRVIVVEDEHVLAETIREGLAQHGFAVDVAYDGTQADAKVSVVRYDVAILDRNLPGMTGDELCRCIAHSGEGTRILMLTSAAQVSDRGEGLSLGAGHRLVASSRCQRSARAGHRTSADGEHGGGDRRCDGRPCGEVLGHAADQYLPHYSSGRSRTSRADPDKSG